MIVGSFTLFSPETEFYQQVMDLILDVSHPCVPTTGDPNIDSQF